MALQIEPAEKFRQFAHVCIWGTEKTGKTHTALTFATALAGEDGRVGVISSEHGSSRLLAHRFPHEIIDLTEANRNNGKPVPNAFAPGRYEEALKMFVDAGYKAIVVDSLSHAWAGQGGLLEVVGKFNNTFSDGWGAATPAYNHLIDTILSTRCHIIITLRAKDDYQMEEYIKSNGTKGQAPKNVGLAPVMRKGFGYEMQLIIRMDDLTAHIQASGIEDYIPRGTTIEKPGPELAYKLLDALDGVPLPEPTPQQVGMRNLLEELYNLSPSVYARYPNWETLALKAAFNGNAPTDYSDEDVERMRVYVATKRQEKAAKTKAS